MGAYERWAAANQKPSELVNALNEARTGAQSLIASFQPAEAPAAAAQTAAVSQAQGPKPAAEHAETTKPKGIFAFLDHDSDFVDRTGWEELAREDKDYSDLVSSFENLTSKISIGQKLSQKQKRATRLSPQRFAAIAKAIEDGKISLPDLDLPSDKDYTAVWALVDSGSAVHVVDSSKTFPNVKVQPPPANHKGFAVAGGTRIKHGGFVTTDAVTNEGQHKTITWKNAAVALPILSAHELARDGHRVNYDENESYIENKRTGEITQFIQKACV